MLKNDVTDYSIDIEVRVFVFDFYRTVEIKNLIRMKKTTKPNLSMHSITSTCFYFKLL